MEQRLFQLPMAPDLCPRSRLPTLTQVLLIQLLKCFVQPSSKHTLNLKHTKPFNDSLTMTPLKKKSSGETFKHKQTN